MTLLDEEGVEGYEKQLLIEMFLQLKRNTLRTLNHSFVHDGGGGIYWRISAQHCNFMLIKFIYFKILVS